MMAGGLKSNVTGHIQFKSTRTFYYSIAPDLLLFYFSTTITLCVCVCFYLSHSENDDQDVFSSGIWIRGASLTGRAPRCGPPPTAQLSETKPTRASACQAGRDAAATTLQ